MPQRLLELVTPEPFGKDAIIMALSGREELSRPFEFVLDISSHNPDVKPDDIIGKPLAVRIDRADQPERFIHGYVNQFSAGDYAMSEGDKSMPSRVYRVRLVPWLWFLTRAARSCVYLPEQEEKSLEDVLKVVIKNVKDYEHVIADVNFSGAQILSSRKLEHCVQYRETDFNFLSRILEQYGVRYYFEYKADKHVMVMSDQPQYPNAVEKDVRYVTSSGGQTNEDFVTSWSHNYDFTSGSWTQKDYNFETPSTNLMVNTPVKSSSSVGVSQNYDVYDYPNDYAMKGDGQAEGTRRMEQEETRFNTVAGASTCKTFMPGYCFKLTEHHSCPSEKGGEYLITSVQHQATQPGPFTSQSVPAAYSNHFTAIPRTAAYRPERLTPQPHLSGVQTAVVIGPPGEEIYTDKYGRVRVQFHWDLLGKPDTHTSCWVRCQQSIAGNRWGFMAIPRVGQEVVISYIEGDLNRPLITGCVYNAAQMPHYMLPADKTKTYIKTNSSPGGNGHNELTFEDKSKEERIYMHAQKDFDMRVLNDSKTRIFGNRHQIIGWEKDGKKGGDQREMVYQDKHQNIKRHQIEHIEGNMDLTVGHGKAESGGEVQVKIEKNRKETIGSSNHLVIGADYAQQIKGVTSIDSGGSIQVKSGAAIAMEAGANGEIHLKAGMKIIIEAGTQVSLVGPGGFVDIGPAGVTIQGTMVNINSGGSAGSGSGCSPHVPVEAEPATPTTPELAHNSTSGSKSRLS